MAGGGKREGSGRPKKALADKIKEGNRGHRPLTVIEFAAKNKELIGEKKPKPTPVLNSKQKDGKPLGGKKIYEQTWEYISERDCATLVAPELIERYAMAVARWRQCEEYISDNGLVYSVKNKEKVVTDVKLSPFVNASEKYMLIATKLWTEIFQIIKENCTTEYKGKAPHDDMMESLLQQRRG